MLYTKNAKNVLTGAVVSFLAAVTVMAMSFGAAFPVGAQTVNNDAAQTPAGENDSNGLFNGDINLEDLIILETLSNNGTAFNLGSSATGNDLVDLFVISELFNGENGDGLFGGDSDNLVDLIILEELFTGNELVTTTTPGTTQTVTDTVAIDTYTVRSGDTLYGIAQRFLGDGSRWTEIANMNGIDDPTELQIGTVLDLPSDATTTTTRTVTVPGTTSTTTSGTTSSNLTDLVILSELFDGNGEDGNGLFSGDNSNLTDLIILESLFNDGVAFGNDQVYVVQRGDTLSEIAQRFYGDASLWPTIADANNVSDPRTLQIGQRLVIPSIGGTGVGTSNLTDLVILSELFGDDGVDGNTLTDLIILEEFFGTGTGVTGTNNLYDLIILDELFSNS